MNAGRGGGASYDAAALPMRVVRSLHLAGIAAFALAVISLVLGKHLEATVLFVIAAACFLATLILQRRR